MSGFWRSRTARRTGSFRRLLASYVSSRDFAWWMQRVAPFPPSGDPADPLRELRRVVASLPRTSVKTATDDYLHAVSRTRLGFRDDLEFRFSPEEGLVHVRSASRCRWTVFDLWENRRRVRRVRRALGKPGPGVGESP